jgi:aminoglycoside phosphotransferase family enzyme
VWTAQALSHAPATGIFDALACDRNGDEAGKLVHEDGTTHTVDVEEKVAFLRRGEHWPGRPARVDVIETHMAWVFLTPTHAFKFKKPVRYAFLDFSTLEKRRVDCEEEVRLNRRLAPDVYLGTEPLTRRWDGVLEVRGSGPPVEWLVRMRRLPRERFLDHAIQQHTWTPQSIERVIEHLVRFYQRTPSEPMTFTRYCERLRSSIIETRDTLLEGAIPAADSAAVRAVANAQLAFLDQSASLLDARVQESRIIESHGDLRPEHVVLTDPPLIIDCLEFNRAFRILDPLDEIAYFTIECDVLGAEPIGRLAADAYARLARDDAPPPLLAFYASCRALLRAKLAFWHVGDDHVSDQDHWRHRSTAYISTAARRLPLFRDVL